METTSRQPLVSVVIPMYNCEAYIASTIDSVLNQTYQTFEILLIDDLSTDGTYALAQTYAARDSRIRLLQNEVNSGAAASRNKGVMAARGSFLAFLDGDDLWLPSKLEKQVAFMKEKQCGFSYTAYVFADKNGKPTADPVKVPLFMSYARALRNHTIWTSTVMINLYRIPKETVMMPNVRRGQDTATWWQILKFIKIAYGLQESLSIYRRTSQSLSSNKFAAIKRTWYLFRKVEKLPLPKAIYSFFHYAINAVKRRL